MTPLLPQLEDILAGMWNGRWAGLLVAWTVGIAAAAYIALTPDRYEATARVFADTRSVLKPLLSGLAVQPSGEQEIEMLSRTLLSRPNLHKLIQMADIDVSGKSTAEVEKLVDALLRTVYIRTAGRENLYVIGYAHPQPAQAKRVVESVVALFGDASRPAKSKGTGEATRFIEEQLRTYEARLTEAENRLKEFKLKNMDPETPAGTDFFSVFSTVTDNLRETRLKLQEAYRARDALKQQLDEEQQRLWAAQQGRVAAIATPELDARLNALHKNLDDLLLRYTENHPDVLNARRMIREMEAQRDEERKRVALQLAAQSSSGSGAGTTAVYPQLKFAMAEAEAQVAALNTRVSDFERRYEQLRRQAALVPEREAQLTQLNRDYAIQKQNYESLVARRETALISGDMEAATGVAQLRVIDPPRVSLTPVFPHRKVLMPLAWLATLCAGLAASYFFSMIYPTFHDGRVLAAVGGRPVLGAISVVPTRAIQARRRHQAAFFFGGLGALAAFLGMVAILMFNLSLLA